MPPGAFLAPTMTPRILVLFRLIAFIGVLYMALHILVARLSRKPESRLLWFFEVLTSPLTRTVARVAPAGTSPARLRWLAFGACVLVWVAAIAADRTLGGPR